MTLPANIRVNVAAPFPTMVTGQNGIALGKQNGIWTVGLSVNSLATSVPPSSAFINDYVIVWDATTGLYSKVALTTLQSGLTPPSITARQQRSVTASPIVVTSTDSILNVNINSGTPTCTLPAASGRGGNALTFKDVGGQFAAHHLTITGNSGDLIDGSASVVLAGNYQALTIYPFNDGVNSGWFII